MQAQRWAAPLVQPPELELIAEAIPHIVWTASPDGAVTYLNQRAEEYTGGPRDQGYGAGWVRYVHPDDVDAAVTAWEKAIREALPFELDYRLRRFDGTYRWHTFRALPMRDSDGSVSTWIGTATDIEDQKELEDSLRRSERALKENLTLLETIHADAPVGLCFVDRNFCVVRVNDVLARLADMPAEEQIGHPLAEIMPAIWPSIRDAYVRALAGDTTLNLDVSGPANGTPHRIRHSLTNTYPVEVDGEIIGVASIVLDVTERRQAEAMERFQSRLLDAAGESIVATDLSGHILYANTAAEALYGWEADALLGRAVTDIVSREGVAHSAPILDELRAGRSWSGDCTGQRKDGTTFPISVTDTPVLDDTGGLVALIGVSSDITERKHTEELLATNVQAMVQTIAATVEARDPYTAGHQARVALLSAAIARQLGLDEHTIEGISTAAGIHDIGKISTPAEILSKPGRLSPLEFELVKEHAQAGSDIVRHIEFAWPVSEMILQHHERMDGSGYPNGLAGEEICLGARIIAVADVVEAVAAHRPYRPGRGLDAGLQQIRDERATRLDAAVVDACLRLFASGSFDLALP